MIKTQELSLLHITVIYCYIQLYIQLLVPIIQNASIFMIHTGHHINTLINTNHFDVSIINTEI